LKIFNPAPNCPRLIDGERRLRGRLFQTIGAAHLYILIAKCYFNQKDALRNIRKSIKREPNTTREYTFEPGMHHRMYSK